MNDDAASEVLIAGGGPAGAALAMLLHRAGRRVTLVSRCRDYRAIEGIARRSLQALQGLGLARAAACAVGPLPRRVTWGGEARAPNAEWLLPRPDFDAALLDDLRAAGIRVVEARIRRLVSRGKEVQCLLADGRRLAAAWGWKHAAGRRRGAISVTPHPGRPPPGSCAVLPRQRPRGVPRCRCRVAAGPGGRACMASSTCSWRCRTQRCAWRAATPMPGWPRSRRWPLCGATPPLTTTTAAPAC